MFGSNLIVFSYLSPETYLPLTSMLATIVGCVLMFWRIVLRAAVRCVRTVLRRPAKARAIRHPHFRTAARAGAESGAR